MTTPDPVGTSRIRRNDFEQHRRRNRQVEIGSQSRSFTNFDPRSARPSNYLGISPSLIDYTFSPNPCSKTQLPQTSSWIIRRFD